MSKSQGTITTLGMAAFGFAFLLAILNEDNITFAQGFSGAMILAALPVLLVLNDAKEVPESVEKNPRYKNFQFWAHAPCFLLICGGAALYLVSKSYVMLIGVVVGVVASIGIAICCMRIRSEIDLESAQGGKKKDNDHQPA